MPKKQSERTNASQQYAGFLEKLSDTAAMRIHVAGQNINVPLPQGDEFKKIAAHMRFLELCVTGISHNERRTIAKLTRRISTLERMVATRDAKIRHHKQELSQMKSEYEAYAKHMQEQFERDLEKAKKITPEKAHEIEKNFIKNLQTSYERQQEQSRAWSKGIKQGLTESYSVYDSARRDNRYYR